MWRPQVLALRGRYRMLAPSLPGFGGVPALSADESQADTMDDYADHVASEMDRAGIRRATICGLSLGGYVAFALLRRYRSRIEAIVLADTRADPDTAEVSERRRSVAEHARAGGGAWMAEHLPALLSERAPAELWDRVRAIVRAQPGGSIARASLAMAARPDSRPDLAGIDVPALIVVGALDTITPPEVARATAAAIPDARLSEIPNAGHLANLEQTDAFSTAVADFLQ